ncbi:Melanoma inhibitory activity protein 3 [Gigaspora margarita]|nr:Melanoma inhibitory activity protein 3 [Gigaspora margarita]
MRDVCNGRVIISHGGGKSCRRQNGSFGLFASQLLTDASVCSLIKNYINKQPLAMIVGNKKNAEFRVPARYCVMGLYYITHAWPEYELNENDDDLTDEEDILNGNNTERNKSKTKREGPFIRWKFRFEWVPDQEFSPWWESPSQKLIYSTILPGTLKVFLCPECVAPSSKIYKTVWICLNHKCNRFWQAWSDKNQWIKVPNNLVYDPVFLNPGLTARDQLHRIPFSILPPQPPSTLNNDLTNSNALYGVQYWKGFHCLRCGRISCRNKWAFWECANCGLRHEVPEQLLAPSMLRNPNLPVLIGPAFDYDSCIKDNSGIIKTSEVSAEGAVVCKYCFPEGGYIIHRIGNSSINKISDQFFIKFQRKDLPFKRNILKKGSNRIGTPLIARQFTMNVGAKYKFSLECDTLRFEETPQIIQDCYNYVQEMCNVLVDGAKFNEMLLAAYLNDQRMSWHDDGEKGVGPIIGNLSLGASAELKFRRKKKKISKNLSDKDCSTDDLSVGPSDHSNSSKDVAEERLSLPYTIFTSPSPYMPIDALELGLKSRGTGPELILKIHHGDLLMMVGHEIQQNYEHALFPEGFRIAATVRYIALDDENLKST